MRDRRPANNSKPKWWNIDIRNILLAKKHAYRRYKSTHSQADKLEYTRIRRETKRLIKISKKLHDLHIASNCKENPKEFFRYIREKKTLKSTIGPLLSAEGEIVTDERETADILNDYFASVFTVEEDRGEEAVPYQMTVAAQLFLVDITEEDVMRVIDKHKICKSPEPDKMPLQNAFQCVIGGQQIIVNPNGGILTSEIFCKPRNVLIGDTNQHIAKQIN